MLTYALKAITVQNIFLVLLLYELNVYYRYRHDVIFFNRIALPKDRLIQNKLDNDATNHKQQLLAYLCIDPPILNSQPDVYRRLVQVLHSNVMSGNHSVVFCLHSATPTMKSNLFITIDPVWFIHPFTTNDRLFLFAHEIAQIEQGLIHRDVLLRHVHHFFAFFNELSFKAMVWKLFLTIRLDMYRTLDNEMIDHNMQLFFKAYSPACLISFSSLWLASHYLHQSVFDADKMACGVLGDVDLCIQTINRLIPSQSMQAPCDMARNNYLSSFGSIFSKQPSPSSRIQHLCKLTSSSPKSEDSYATVAQMP